VLTLLLLASFLPDSVWEHLANYYALSDSNGCLTADVWGYADVFPYSDVC
jgi:hypothetical protein